jgi:hypothetical protein
MEVYYNINIVLVDLFEFFLWWNRVVYCIIHVIWNDLTGCVNSKSWCYMELPVTFPALPGPGPPNNHVQRAYDLMSMTYNQALQLHRQDDNDPLCMNFHMNCIESCAFPLISALVESVPANWLKACAHILGQLLVDLRAAIRNVEN